ncbi:Csa1p Ecym_2805 [Eremothecium cymbalariae DBVPG|uniref:Uncharacterized protein n=1 Tax=Eremothecium cymbalariae (strain CBS 270.75 / DBVPG 7215 / KCTC 17166 / NRRL Y-17582) TaxID=931890 RepID=G8JQD9_ERECY|nr:Hypothetical protein Ecym_2805 [Eremothecium cymbalariae DBVPG\
MFQPLKDMMMDMWSGDSRKKEYGSLEEWKQIKQNDRIGRPRRATGRYKVTKHSAVHKSVLPIQQNRRDGVFLKQQRQRQEQEEQRDQQQQQNDESPTWWERLTSVFSSEQRDLYDMKNAFTNYRLPFTNEHESRRRRATNSQRIARSETLKKRMMEKIYDDKMLQQLRETGNPNKRAERLLGLNLSNSESDQVVLLQNRLRKLEQQLFDTQKELEIANKKLTFAQEKTKLFESLLDEANVDNEYVKSRRRISNLRTTAEPQLRSLSPSPKRPYPLNPLFTSSPMRAHNADSPGKHPNDIHDFYAKYPSLPKTEVLNNKGSAPDQISNSSESLSPVRIDYNKYSSPRLK